MKKVFLEGRNFNRLIAATKGFVGKDNQRPIYRYIKLDVEKSMTRGGLVTAAACDGYRLSVERARAVQPVDESFSCYIPVCRNMPASSFVSIELVKDGRENDVLIRCEDMIFGCRQPKCKDDFVNYEKFFDAKVAFRVAFYPEYLKKALAAAEASTGNVKAPLVFEFNSPRDPCYIKTGSRRENLKMVLPMRIEDGVAYEGTEAQIDFLDEIIVDNFAGGGGASTGIELATGRPVTIAINHDPAAILMHKTNHPYTEHLQASVWDIDPVKVCAGRPVGLAWFSPDCKHFSKAKGSALVDRNIRGLAWIVLRWAGTVRPRVIILENVEEFQTWGPVRKGKPVKKKAGQTFCKWLSQLRELGYDVEYRELVAADYGAPTTRKRFVLVARCDGKPIVWPERTHAPAGSELVKSGKCKPWRAAAEIIDWTVPMYSVFETKEEIKAKYGVNAVRPLADNTMRRIIRGVDKHTIKSGDPFIIGVGGRCADCPPRSVMEPHRTATTKADAAICNPILSPFTFSNTGSSAGVSADDPVGTVRTAGGQILAAANLIQYHTEQTENVRSSGLADPLQTVDGSNRHGLVSAHLVEYYSTGRPLNIKEPLHTVTGHDREAMVSAVIHPIHDGGYKGKGNKPDIPLNTVTSSGGMMLAAHHITEFKGQDIGQRMDKPLRTITAGGGEFAVVGTEIRNYEPGSDLGYWPEIRALLNRHCGYTLADNEVLLLKINGRLWFISDITMRMLTPKELYAAMGFPPDYIIERDYTGRPYPKNAQVARCGNAVCPQMASAVVRANMPEWSVTITTMAALHKMVAV